VTIVNPHWEFVANPYGFGAAGGVLMVAVTTVFALSLTQFCGGEPAMLTW
jgi:hypothetical protein